MAQTLPKDYFLREHNPEFYVNEKIHETLHFLDFLPMVNNEYGEFTDVPVTANGTATTLNVTKASGIRTNEELAFLRAMGMKNAMQKGVQALKTMDTSYETHVEEAEGVGGQFRRIFVDYIFEDAF